MKTEEKVWDWRTYVLKKGPEEPLCKLILLTLSCYMNSAGKSCFPSIKTLVEVTSLTKPTVLKYLKMAKDEGWIKVSKHGYAGQKWARNEYTAAIPKAVKEFNKGSQTHSKEGKAKSKRRSNSLSTNSTSTSTSNSSTEKYTRDDLLELYEKYPIQAARGKALTEIKKALKRLDKESNINNPLEWLATKVETFSKSPKGKGDFVPYPANWFSDERYFDDPQAWENKYSKSRITNKADKRERIIKESKKDRFQADSKRVNEVKEKINRKINQLKTQQKDTIVWSGVVNYLKQKNENKEGG